MRIACFPSVNKMCICVRHKVFSCFVVVNMTANSLDQNRLYSLVRDDLFSTLEPLSQRHNASLSMANVQMITNL